MSPIFKNILLVCCFAVSFGVGHAQNSAVSLVALEKKLQKAVTPFDRAELLIQIGEKFMETNVSKADSIRQIISEQSVNFEGVELFKCMLFEVQMMEINGEANGYYDLVRKFTNYQDEALENKDAFYKQLHLGYYYSSFLDFDNAEKALNRALEYAKKMRSYTALTDVHCKFAYFKMLNNQKDSSLYHTERAIQYARRSGFKKDLCNSFNQQSITFEYFGQMELAVSKNLVAYQLANSINDLFRMARYAREIGQKQLGIGNLKDAEYYFTRSFEYSTTIHDGRQMGLALASKAEVLRKKGKGSDAIRLNERAIGFLARVQDINGLAEAHNNLGLVYKDMSAYPLAVIQFNKSLVYFEKSFNREKIAEVYFNVATIFKKQHRLNKALNYLFKSLEIQQNFGSRNKVYATYKEMAEIYKNLGNKDLALKYMEMYIEFTDENSIIQASKKIAELSESYRSEQRDRLISVQADSLNKQLQEKELTDAKLENISLRNDMQTYIIIGFLIIIVLAIVIASSRFKQSGIQQKRKEAEMSQTLLRTQMNPHFIFNAMSVIQSYIYENDVKNSSKFLVNFSRLMRLILENSPKEFIRIETEMEILQKYLETQKLRFEERFEFEIECSDELIFDKAMIPPMITQPFIENAIEHGQLHTVKNGFIRIVFAKEKKMLVVIIEDNGVGRKGSASNKKSTDHKSMAMDITGQRIDNLNDKYKSDGKMIVSDLNPLDETGTKVVISLPYKQESPELAKYE